MDRHSRMARSKSSDTRRLLGRGVAGGTLEGSGGVGVKGRITVALLNFEAEKRFHILLIVSCGGSFFLLFDFDLPENGGAGGGGLPVRLFLLSLSDALESSPEDIVHRKLDTRLRMLEKNSWRCVARITTSIVSV